jgi:hypothetical protein
VGFLDRLFGKRSTKSQNAGASEELGISSEDLFAKLEQDTMDFDEFRQKVIALIWREDNPGLSFLCENQLILTPIFIEKAIEEISPGNKWNDMLWLMARRLIEAGNWPHLAPLLEDKRHLVPNPEGGRKVMEPFVVVTRKPIDETLNLPPSLLRLIHADMTGLDHEDDTTIDKMFAEFLVIGPGFYRKYLSSIDFPYGDRVLIRVPMGRPPQLKVFEGRVLRDRARLIPLLLDEFEAILSRYRSEKIRHATQGERDLFYSLIDFEIAERPVYVVEAEEGRLLIYLKEGDRIHWIESLDAWQREDRSSPLGSLDSSTLDAIRKDFE